MKYQDRITTWKLLQGNLMCCINNYVLLIDGISHAKYYAKWFIYIIANSYSNS